MTTPIHAITTTSSPMMKMPLRYDASDWNPITPETTTQNFANESANAMRKIAWQVRLPAYASHVSQWISDLL